MQKKMQTFLIFWSIIRFSYEKQKFHFHFGGLFWDIAQPQTIHTLSLTIGLTIQFDHAL